MIDLYRGYLDWQILRLKCLVCNKKIDLWEDVAHCRDCYFNIYFHTYSCYKAIDVISYNGYDFTVDSENKKLSLYEDNKLLFESNQKILTKDFIENLEKFLLLK